MKDKKVLKVVIIVALAFILRIVIAYFTKGFNVDVNCFSSWAMDVYRLGASDFYSPDYFCDYLPGYINVLYLLGFIKDIFGIAYDSAVWITILKTPAIIADVLISILAYKLAKKKSGEKKSFIILLITAFNPLLIFNSAVWGQIDSIMLMLILVTFYLYFSNKKILAGLIYGISILVKTQCLMVGPILAIIYIYDIIKKRDMKTVRDAVFAVIAAFGAIFLVSFPYKGEQNFFWIIEKAFLAAGGYPYITVNAANIPLVVFGNWAPIEQTFLGIKTIVYGYVGIVISYIFSLVSFVKIKVKDNGLIIFITSIFLFGVYMIGPYMHERYIFMVPFLFIFAYIELKNKYMLWMSILTTAICLINSAVVYFEYNNNAFINFDEILIYLGYFATLVFVLSIAKSILMIKKGELLNDRILEEK